MEMPSEDIPLCVAPAAFKLNGVTTAALVGEDWDVLITPHFLLDLGLMTQDLAVVSGRLFAVLLAFRDYLEQHLGEEVGPLIRCPVTRSGWSYFAKVLITRNKRGQVFITLCAANEKLKPAGDLN